jgi:hypothetical protein
MPIFLGNQEIGLASLGSLPVANIQQGAPSPSIPTTNLVFWLDSTTFTTGSSTWVSNFGLLFSGSFTGATPVQKRADNGGVVNFTTSSAMKLGGNSGLNYTASNYTLFVVNRYTGSAADSHGRLLDGVNNNWLAPTYGGGGGGGAAEYHSAYYNTSTFIIQSGSIYDTEWRISTVVRDIPNLSSSFYVNSILAATGANNATTNGFNGLAINNGQSGNGTINPATGEVTQADVGDILLYNTVLNQAEINNVYNALKLRYGL